MPYQQRAHRDCRGRFTTQGDGQSEVLNFPVRTTGPEQPGPSNTIPAAEREQQDQQVPQTPMSPDGGSETTLLSHLGSSGYQPNTQAVDREALPVTGEDNSNNVLGNNVNNNNNYITQPLRRSNRIPNTRPRELYPGSVRYV